MFELNEKTKEAIRKETGLEFDRAVRMDHEELRSAVEQKIDKKLSLMFIRGNGFLSRGSVYLDLGRVLRADWLERQMAGF
jgi:hypothetical protein